jgi:hypothetical protein
MEQYYYHKPSALTRVGRLRLRKQYYYFSSALNIPVIGWTDEQGVVQFWSVDFDVTPTSAIFTHGDIPTTRRRAIHQFELITTKRRNA